MDYGSGNGKSKYTLQNYAQDENDSVLLKLHNSEITIPNTSMMENSDGEEEYEDTSTIFSNITDDISMGVHIHQNHSNGSVANGTSFRRSRSCSRSVSQTRGCVSPAPANEHDADVANASLHDEASSTSGYVSLCDLPTTETATVASSSIIQNSTGSVKAIRAALEQKTKNSSSSSTLVATNIDEFHMQQRRNSVENHRLKNEAKHKLRQYRKEEIIPIYSKNSIALKTTRQRNGHDVDDGVVIVTNSPSPRHEEEQSMGKETVEERTDSNSSLMYSPDNVYSTRTTSHEGNRYVKIIRDDNNCDLNIARTKIAHETIFLLG